MAQKSRTIHPADAQDERLANLPLSAAYTYAYLPTILDDEGRAKDQPSVFNGYLWPLRADAHTTDAMISDISALVEAGLLCRYSVGGQDYLHDPAWQGRQKIARPIPSILPGCPTHDKTFDEVIAETLHKVSDQVNAFLRMAATGLDEAKIRDSVAHIVEDVALVVDPERAASYGQQVRGFFTKTTDTKATDTKATDTKAIDTKAIDTKATDPTDELPAREAGGNGKDTWKDGSGQPPPA